MLLALYCLPSRGEMLRPTALSHAAAVAEATGIRWQRILTAEGLIERGPQQLPSRRQFVRLTQNGRSLMDRYLTRLFFCKTPIPPHPDRAGG
jgi:DNA-binding MarR family transcriptional regulator